ncbi:carboxylating nicotinate-nucleotide diphosphorylase [Candidatus Viridilinea mediisalina]|uniref:Probable nicotinate-nucleotide pyrophosphorylase [carboxylating] n=1 Tax=Candidatus Viridilinea mediisalina TaxID=2024553 RepID=A0A2A6RKC4_9CHLR|nr:carboxylating nicotinate-nucleotide diphosphorylase [Candidatus Viridilinea mediisalina]PDW03472.1 nicotinate-nucleotide diphosphorylase (carboxylating) [Candidatus Viridilinea mediisalina]
MHELPPDLIKTIVSQALAEDIGTGDLTTLNAIPSTAQAEAQFVFREPGVVCGLPLVEAVFAALAANLVVTRTIAEGSKATAGQTVATVAGPARGILTGERVALNLFQRLSGIATLAANYVAAVAATPARILDTRKTTPGLRVLEKYAVRMGGATNHRFGLYDGVMLKDNHLAILSQQGIDLTSAIQDLRTRVGPMVCIEVEVESAAAAAQAAAAGADMILLDNMHPAQLREAVVAIAGRARCEASGGITLDNIHAIATSGVDYISIGALTHSARALDIGLDAIADCRL